MSTVSGEDEILLFKRGGSGIRTSSRSKEDWRRKKLSLLWFPLLFSERSPA